MEQQCVCGQPITERSPSDWACSEPCQSAWQMHSNDPTYPHPREIRERANRAATMRTATEIRQLNPLHPGRLHRWFPFLGGSLDGCEHLADGVRDFQVYVQEPREARWDDGCLSPVEPARTRRVEKYVPVKHSPGAGRIEILYVCAEARSVTWRGARLDVPAWVRDRV